MKKGESIMFTLTSIGVAAAIITFFIVIVAAQKHKLANGEDQLAALQTFYKAEQFKNYLDQSTLLSMQSSAFRLGADGGYHQTYGESGDKTDLGCGSFNGVPLWNTNQKECYVNSATAQDSYKRLIAEYLDSYISNYPDMSLFISPQDFLVKTTADSTTVQNLPAISEVTVDIKSQDNNQEDNSVPEKKWTFWPVDGQVTDCFGGPRGIDGSFHDGVDFNAAVGTPVKVVETGKVYQTCSCVIGDRYCCGGYGNNIVVKHSASLYTRYAHLSKLNLKKDDDVKTGEVIGLSGNTGYSTGPHLHFATYTSEKLYSKGDYSQNPFRFLPSEYKNFKESCPLDRYGSP